MAKIDLQGCESCGKQFPIEAVSMMEDCWYCEPCIAEWRAEFDACNHEWSPHVDCMGDEGKLCSRCSGFIADDASPTQHMKG